MSKETYIKDIHHWVRWETDIKHVRSIIWAIAMQYIKDPKSINYLKKIIKEIKEDHEY